MSIQGGSLQFDVLFNTGQIDRALEETKRRVQGFSDATAAGGQKMEEAYQSAASYIKEGFSTIGHAISVNQNAIANLQKKYNDLGVAAAEAFMKGNDTKHRDLTAQQASAQEEITARKKVASALTEENAALAKLNKDLEDQKNKVDNASNAQGRFRTQLLNVKNEMMKLEQAGQKNTAEYARLVEEAKRLANAMYSANQQIKTLTSTKGATLQGLVSGITGVSGAFTAAQGAMGLFADKNEDLQKIMLKVQSLMSITMGIQAVSSTIHETSAFRLTVLGGVQKWWTGIIVKTNAALLASTVEGKAAALAADRLAAAEVRLAAATAIVEKQEVKRGTASAAAYARLDAAQKSLIRTKAAHTVAVAAETKAAGTATVANTGLAGSFRLIGTAIKSIPVFGWIAIALGALITAFAIFSSKAKEAKKEMEEFNKKAAETAAKPISTFKQLTLAWSKLGDDIKAKEKFIDDSKEKFNSLGVSVKNVAEAEKLLIDNKDKFIEAQMMKAKAAAAAELATEKYKEAYIKAAELEETPKERKSVTKSVNGAPVEWEMIHNFRYDEIEKEKKKLEKAADDLFLKSATFTEQEQKILAEIGQSANRITEGSIAAVEASISKLTDEYKSAASDLERNDLLKQIKVQETMLSKMNLLKGNSGGAKDPFKEELESKKKAYQDYVKWLNAGLGKEAQQEFSSLLESGKTYREYLANRLKDEKLTGEEIHKINTAIAEETTHTVLGDFQKSLQKQMDSARNVLDLIDLIKRKREEIEASDDPLKQQKIEILVKESESADKKRDDETSQLLKSYTDYLDEKINFELQYGERHKKLNDDLVKAATDSERKIVLSQLEGLERDRKKYEKQTGNEEYDELLNKYRSFEQKKTEITEEYERKRNLLTEQLSSSDTLESERMKIAYAMQQLEKDYNKSVSELATEELTNTDSWKKLFDDLDNLTAQQIDTLVNEIESNFESLSVQFNPIDLKAIRDKLTEAKAIVLKDNPFKAVGVAIREVFNDSAGGSKKSAEQIKKDWNNLGKATEDAFKFVTDAVSSCDFLKDAIGEIGAAAIGTLSTVATIAIATATAIKSAEKASVILAIIQAVLVVVQAVAGFIKSIINSNDKKLEKKVQQHLNNVKTLQKEYQKLERIVDKSLGEDHYTSQKDALANLKQQQAELAAAAENERKKKKSDSGKIAEYEAATEEIGIKMLDIIDKVREEVMGGTAKSIANDLGNAFIDAFASGEDALGSFKKKADEVISGIIQKMLIQKLIEKPIGEIIDRYSQKWVNSDGTVLNFDEIMRGASMMGDELKTVGTKLSAAMESLPDEIKKYLMNNIDDAEITSLSGAIKGASQESINVLTGYMNNSAITQREEAELIRQALLLISNIDMKLGVSNNHLASIDSKLNSTNEILRSQGIIG